MDEVLKDLGEYVAGGLPGDILGAEIRNGELTLTARRDGIEKVVTYLRDDSNCQFKAFVDIAGVDYPDRAERFEVVYHLLSVSQNLRVRIKIATDEHTPVPSIAGIYSAADWYEREVWDLYGVYFSNHPDLRRLLTDYGFQGHPLRKDFPLTGHVEVRYDEEQKRVVYEPVSLTQEFRSFDFLSPWEGAPELMQDIGKDEDAAADEGA